MLEIEKKESKGLTFFQKLLEKISWNPYYDQSRQSQRMIAIGNVYEQEMFTRKMTKN